MANLREAFDYASKNPTSDFAKNLEQMASSGALNLEAKKYGIDLTPFQPQETLAPVEQPKRTLGEKILDFTGGKEIAQGLGQAIAQPEISKGIEETQASQIKIQGDLLERIKQNKAQGVDTSRLENALAMINEDIQATGQGAEKLLNPNELTNKQVIGDALQLATTAGGAKLAGTLGGKVAQATTATKGAILGAKAGALGGAGVGALTGTSQALQKDKSGVDIAKEAVGGALIGAGTGGIIGALTGGLSGLIQGKKIVKSTLDNHLASVKQEFDNLTPEQIQAGGGKDALLAQNKKDIILQLKDAGLTDKANLVDKVNTKNVSSVDQYINDIRDSLSGKARTKTDFALDLVSPKATEAIKQQALKEGRVTEQGLLSASRITPSKRDFQLAEAVKGVVDPKKSAPQNLNLIEAKVNDINTGVKAYVKANKVPFNTNQLSKQLDDGKDELDLIFASDKNAEKTYNAVKRKFIELVQNKDTAGLMDARQEFDKIPAVKKLLESDKLGENARKEIVMSIRTQANKYIASLLPKGNQYRETLLKESRMLEAIGNLAEKNTGIIGANKLQSLTQKYPILNWLAGGIGAGLVGGASIGVGRSIIGSSD